MPRAKQNFLFAGTIILITLGIQYGPSLIGLAFRESLEFNQTGPLEYEASIEHLPSGPYYISLGRTLTVATIFVDNETLVTSAGSHGTLNSLSLAMNFEVKDRPLHPKVLRISLASIEQYPWYRSLFNLPLVTSPVVGIVIHALREFVDEFLGPLFGLSLFLLVVAYSVTNNATSKATASISVYALVYFIYSIYLSGYPDLVSLSSPNALIQGILRCGVSAAFINIYRVFARTSYWPVYCHVIPTFMLVVADKLYPLSLGAFYRVFLFFYFLITLYATYRAARTKHLEETIRNILVSLGIAWTGLQLLANVAYFVSGPSFLTVLSPAFFSISAILVVYGLLKAMGRQTLESSLLAMELQTSQRLIRVASQVAHDISSPLAAIASLLKNSPQLDSETKAAASFSLERAKTACNELLSEYRLMRRLGAISIEHGAQSTLIDIQKTAVLILQEKQREFIEHRNLKIELGHCCEGNVFAQANQGSLQRVISNLLNNAAEATNFSGRIVVSVFENADDVILEILDDGKGIPQETVKSLNEGILLSSKSHGLGLGISFAQACARAWNAHLILESVPGEKTRVAICWKK